MSHLQITEFLFEMQGGPERTYTFKHILTREVAYQSLLPYIQRQYHLQVAQLLEVQVPAVTETQPELLAHHYNEAERSEQAVRYWQQAGQRALDRSANLEAIAHLTKGLELLTTLPETLERAQQEIDLQITLGKVLLATKGQAAPELKKAYDRARQLCQQIGKPSQLFMVLVGLRLFSIARGELQTAQELSEQLLDLAQNTQDPMLLMGAHFMLGVSFFYRGELVLTRIHLEQGNAFYEPQHFRSYLSYYGYDPGVTGLSYLAMVLWLLGYLDQALQQSHEALVLAQEHGHSFNLAAALILTAVLHQYRREGQAVQERAEAAIALATDQGFSHGAVIGTILRGWALAEQGQGAEGVAQIRQGLAAYQATGTVLVHSYLLALLAEAYSTVGQCEEGVHVLAEALTLVNHRGERWWETELYRHKGELLLVQKGERMKGGPRLMPHAKTVSKAESCFHHALAIARRQKAKSLELRAALSLSRLWQQQGKRDAAHALLAESYGWFTEGFDTVDLKEAKALLDTLSSPA